MKKLFLNLFCIASMAIALPLFTACSDDDNDGGDDNTLYDEYNKAFTDGTSGSTLTMTYGGQPLSGKCATFETTDGKTATITLLASPTSVASRMDIVAATDFSWGPVPGEKSTVLHVDLKSDGEGGFIFEGEDKTNARTVVYSGQVDKESLDLDLTVTLHNELAGTAWKLVDYDAAAGKSPFHINWASKSKINISMMGQELSFEPGELLNRALALPMGDDADEQITAAQLLPMLLREVRFLADGNIQAVYCDEENLLNPITSPLGYAHYSVADGKLLVMPNLALMMQDDDATRSLTDEEEEQLQGLLLGKLLNALPDLLPLVSNGLPLDYAKDDNQLNVFIGMDLAQPIFKVAASIFADEQIMALIAKELTPDADDTLEEQQMAALAKAVLEQLPAVIADTQTFEVGLSFEPKQ